MRGGFVGRIGGGPLDAAADRARASAVSGAGSFCGVGLAGVAANVLIPGLTSTRTLRTRVPVAVTTRALSERMQALSQPAAAAGIAVSRKVSGR
jgi:hypothetical protein